MQKIGNLFIRPVELDLMPGVALNNGIYQISVSATLIRPDDPYMYETQTSTWFSRNNLVVCLGDDVHSLIYTIESVNKNGIYKHFSMLKTDLMLLNMANSLVKPTLFYP